MADITQTAANVRAYEGATVKPYTAGGTITAGDAVYKDTTDSDKWKRCDASVAASAVAGGIAMTNAASGDIVYVAIDGDVNPGGTVVVAEVYVVSTNAGKIAPLADLASGEYMTILGYGVTSSKLRLNLKVSGVAKP